VGGEVENERKSPRAHFFSLSLARLPHSLVPAEMSGSPRSSVLRVGAAMASLLSPRAQSVTSSPSHRIRALGSTSCPTPRATGGARASAALPGGPSFCSLAAAGWPRPGGRAFGSRATSETASTPTPTPTPTPSPSLDSSSRGPPGAAYVPDRYLTVPNLMTVARMALAPFVGWSIVTGDFSTAFYASLAAALLDGLDGWVARTFDQASVVGSYLDPIADKLFITCAFLGLAQASIVGPALVTLVIGRDGLLILGGLLHRRSTKPDGVAFFSTSHMSTLQVTPSTLSKVNTALQLSLVCASLTGAAWGVPPLDGAFLTGLSAGVAGTTILSGLDYVTKYGYAERGKKGGEGGEGSRGS
jgi:cardiolipin synthase (CMP-forming)